MHLAFVLHLPTTESELKVEIIALQYDMTAYDTTRLFRSPYNQNTKPPECVDIVHCTSGVFTAGALEARVSRTSAFRAPAGKTE